MTPARRPGDRPARAALPLLLVLMTIGVLAGLLVAGSAFPGGRDPVDRCPRSGAALRAQREPWSARIACSSQVARGARTTGYVAASASDWVWLAGGGVGGALAGLAVGGVLAARRRHQRPAAA